MSDEAYFDTRTIHYSRLAFIFGISRPRLRKMLKGLSDHDREISISRKQLRKIFLNGVRNTNKEYAVRDDEDFEDFTKRLPVTASLRKMVLERDKQTCRYCALKLDHNSFVIDHVLPVSRDGDNSLDNLVAACRKCNLTKKAKTPEEANMPLLPIPEM